MGRGNLANPSNLRGMYSSIFGGDSAVECIQHVPELEGINMMITNNHHSKVNGNNPGSTLGSQSLCLWCTHMDRLKGTTARIFHSLLTTSKLKQSEAKKGRLQVWFHLNKAQKEQENFLQPLKQHSTAVCLNHNNPNKNKAITPGDMSQYMWGNLHGEGL